ncbi:hypothetical protein M0R45_000350 [Rubus argutus]|uniref:Uncharacterized protein n=1 Tax=Rubus argutus TaxID=59490 RepID=A0AAW1VRE3_RUBAR
MFLTSSSHKPVSVTLTLRPNFLKSPSPKLNLLARHTPSPLFHRRQSRRDLPQPQVFPPRHRAIITDLQNKRRGTASTLTRVSKHLLKVQA